MIAARLSMMRDMKPMLSMDDMLPEKQHLRDITKDTDARFFIEIPKGNQVAKASCCIVGGQGCGKSKLLEWRVAKAYKKYGEENVHVIYTDDIRVALDLINDQPVQYIIIDDAMTYASSRQVFQQTEIVKTYNKSRHVFEEKLQGKPGLILYDWAWQRFGELDPSFRQGDVLIFKTGIAEPSERKLITGFLGEWYTKILWQIWDKMNRGNNAIKSTSVACIASLDPSVGVGLYRSGLTDVRLPPMVTHDEHFSDDTEVENILAKYREDPVWARRIQCYELSQQGLKQMEIAEKLSVRQGYVSESISKVRSLIEKK
ncbi:MAG: hypothetical protein IJT54_02465 [Candidatus Methanomethylophilaceae archaeon]|nr:hypothetical protein [Candidatus Methanomethylophilaceae archaeon]